MDGHRVVVAHDHFDWPTAWRIVAGLSSSRENRKKESVLLEGRSFPPPLNLFGEPWSPAMAVRRIYGAGTGTAENDRKGVHIGIKKSFSCFFLSKSFVTFSSAKRKKKKTKKKKKREGCVKRDLQRVSARSILFRDVVAAIPSNKRFPHVAISARLLPEQPASGADGSLILF